MSGKAASTPTATPVTSLADEYAATLNALAVEVLELRAVEKSFKAQADTIVAERIRPLLDKLGLHNSIIGDTWTLVHTKGRATLKPELLLQAGVPMATIEKCKVTGKPSWSVRATDDKSDNGEGASE